MRAVVSAAIVLGLWSGVDAGAAAPATGHTVTDLSHQEQQVLAWALDRYEQAGLDLPSIDFVGHESFDDCRGGGGLFRDEQGRSTIHICGDHPRKFDESLFLHEIAHAWDAATLDPSDRAEFAELRGLSQWWVDGEHDWNELAAEHAAEIVTWALRDHSMAVYTIPDADCDALHAGYVVLTGREPLHDPGGDAC